MPYCTDCGKPGGEANTCDCYTKKLEAELEKVKAYAFGMEYQRNELREALRTCRLFLASERRTCRGEATTERGLCCGE